MRPDNKVELTSNIADETVFDEQIDILQKPAENSEDQPQLSREEPYTDKELEAAMGF